MPATNEKYTLNIEPVGDRLRVTIPELGVTVETAPGEIARDDAIEAGNRGITDHLLALKKPAARKRSTQAKTHACCPLQDNDLPVAPQRDGLEPRAMDANSPPSH